MDDDRCLKVADATGADLVLEGPIVLFGGRDLTGEYFHRATVFESPYTETGRFPVDWEHGLEPDRDELGRKIPQPGRDDVLGYVDWTTARSDDIGLLARCVLNRRARYVAEFVEPLARAALLGASSEAIREKVVKQRDGRIDVWPLKRQALTVTPTEVRMLTDEQIRVIKSLETAMPALKSLVPVKVWGSEPDQWRALANLFDAAGTHLTGRSVKVRVRKPHLAGTWGLMMPDGSGGAVIDIDPGLAIDQAYKIWLHETAHCRHHYTRVAVDIAGGWLDLPPASKTLAPERTSSPQWEREESEAEAQAARWDAWATANAKRLTGEPVVNKTLALLEMQVYRNGE